MLLHHLVRGNHHTGTMGRSSQKLATLVSVVLFPAALLLFSSGFFPYKPFLPGLATFEDEINSIRPPAVFDKVIFMVVDALRRYD